MIIQQDLAEFVAPDSIVLEVAYGRSRILATSRTAMNSIDAVFGGNAKLGDLLSAEGIVFSDIDALICWKNVTCPNESEFDKVETVNGRWIAFSSRLQSGTYDYSEREVRLRVVDHGGEVRVFIAKTGAGTGVVSIVEQDLHDESRAPNSLDNAVNRRTQIQEP